MRLMKYRILVLIIFLLFTTFAVVFILVTNLDKCSNLKSEPEVITHVSRRLEEKYFLLIVIFSSPSNIERRNVIRRTWLQLCKGKNIKYYFVIGTKNISQRQMVQIEQEQNTNDLILIQSVQDAYNTLTKKVLEAFVWLDKNLIFNYVLKCDEDSFVNIPELMQVLKDFEDNGSGKNLYLGFFNGHASVKKVGKWKEQEWVLCDHYLPYALGGGYVLSSHLINFIARNANDFVLFQSEDVSVGVWLANKANVHRRHDPRFDTEFKSRGCSNKFAVTHKQDVTAQEKLYQNLITTGKLCEKEFQSRLSYIYNWDVPPSQCCTRTSAVP